MDANYENPDSRIKIGSIKNIKKRQNEQLEKSWYDNAIAFFDYQTFTPTCQLCKPKEINFNNYGAIINDWIGPKRLTACISVTYIKKQEGNVKTHFGITRETPYDGYGPFHWWRHSAMRFHPLQIDAGTERRYIEQSELKHLLQPNQPLQKILENIINNVCCEI